MRRRALREFLDAWEAEEGPLTTEELAEADAWLKDALREAQEKAREYDRRRHADPAA